jgi:serine/threonine protein kinase
MEDSIALVTESCVPFENWISKIKLETLSLESRAHLVQELVWGFRCIILALNFLHSNGGLLHGNLGKQAIFVMPDGDWKVASMELACNMSLSEDVDFFCRHHNILSKPFTSPERLTLRIGDSTNNETVLKAKNPPYYIDIYSLGQCIHATFGELDLEIPSNLSKYIALMIHSDIKKRPTALKLSQSAVFNSDYIKLLDSINELSLKSPKDALEVLGMLEPKVSELSKSMCAHKILPNVCRTLQIAINDFSNRDARESCRQVSSIFRYLLVITTFFQNVQVSVNLLSAMAAIDKLDEVMFRKSCVPILVQLWPMTDRTVRTVLLQSLKNLAALTPSTVVNKTIFDNIVAGFSDSNAK